MGIHLVEASEILLERLCDDCKGTGRQPVPFEGAPPERCVTCRGGGMLPTPFGRQVLSLVSRWRRLRRPHDQPEA